MPNARKPFRSEDHLLWLDLEMTGLDATRDVILQAAAIVTTSALEPLVEWVTDIWQPEEKLALMTPFVRQMHEKTGLLERVRKSVVSSADAEAQLLELISNWCVYRVPVCGNTVWQDKVFVDRHWPGVSRYLHYRVVDVSSIKLLARRWYGEAAVLKKSEVGAHDALVDIKNSIAELEYYRQSLFRAPRA